MLRATPRSDSWEHCNGTWNRGARGTNARFACTVLVVFTCAHLARCQTSLQLSRCLSMKVTYLSLGLADMLVQGDLMRTQHFEGPGGCEHVHRPWKSRSFSGRTAWARGWLKKNDSKSSKDHVFVVCSWSGFPDCCSRTTTQNTRCRGPRCGRVFKSAK